MPRHSAKKRQEQELFELFVAQLGSEGLTDSTMDLLCTYEGLKEQRYMNSRRVRVPKSLSATDVLAQLDDTQFRSYTRVTRRSFDKIVDLIRHDDVFANKSSCSQTPVELQLHYALYRLGRAGSAGGVKKSATTWGVSAGHIVDCTSRVVQALFNIRDDFVKWSDRQGRQRESLANDAREGFAGAVGKLDGTDVVLEFKPDGDYQAESFRNRNNKYALDLCAVCNSRKEFTYYLAGWANPQPDSRIFASTSIAWEPERYFEKGQYLLGDAAYQTSEYLIAPYQAPASPDNRRFNQKLSTLRADIDHAFGMLKGRWESLTGLRVLIKTQAGYKSAVHWIIACVVLHNILLSEPFQDEWHQHEGWWDAATDVEEQFDVGQELQSDERREAVKATVLGLES